MMSSCDQTEIDIRLKERCKCSTESVSQLLKAFDDLKSKQEAFIKDMAVAGMYICFMMSTDLKRNCDLGFAHTVTDSPIYHFAFLNLVHKMQCFMKNKQGIEVT